MDPDPLSGIVFRMDAKNSHWADRMAEKIVREKGEKEVYVCASGITPSGTIHIGNFREIISVELVVRALKRLGKNARFIYSWDEYDVFRKVPPNMPNQELLSTFLRQPITLVPDPGGKERSYARANEVALERLLPVLGIAPDYIYQASRYRSSDYAAGIKRALDSREKIRGILDAHRTAPLPEEWMPVSIFCQACHKDTTEPTGYDGEWALSYSCSSCETTESLDLRSTDAVKLPWRIDWPMRWKEEGVDFEPAGKDHHSEGGSFDTAKRIVSEVYDGEPPSTFQYDFVRIKGGSGKISSSSGDVVSLDTLMEVYQPEVIRYLFASTRPNSEFAISFDLDVLKIYEDYDRCERVYFSEPSTPKARQKREREARIYELSQVDAVPATEPFQIPIRHLCNLLQINTGDVERTLASIPDVTEEQLPRLRQRARCSWNWITNYAPEEFRFSLRTPEQGAVEVGATERRLLKTICTLVESRMGTIPEKEFGSLVYDVARDEGMESKELFTTVYRALIGKESGPRLIGFLHTIGRERVVALLKLY